MERETSETEQLPVYPFITGVPLDVAMPVNSERVYQLTVDPSYAVVDITNAPEELTVSVTGVGIYRTFTILSSDLDGSYEFELKASANDRVNYYTVRVGVTSA